MKLMDSLDRVPRENKIEVEEFDDSDLESESASEVEEKPAKPAKKPAKSAAKKPAKKVEPATDS